MGITCSTETTLIEREGVQWDVEKGAEEFFYEGERYPSLWENRLSLWLPDPSQTGEAYLFSKEMSRAGEKAHKATIGVVVVDPRSINSGVRARFGGAGSADACCLDKPAAIMTTQGGRGRVSRIHGNEAGWIPELPNLDAQYEPRTALTGEKVEIFGEMADRLHALGVLITPQMIAVLWGDDDNEPRGFEKVANMADVQTERYGFCDQELMVIGDSPDNYEFRGYDVVPEATSIADAVREALGVDDEMEI